MTLANQRDPRYCALVLNEQTVFIVGAGASVEVGLPSGVQLTETIAKLLDFEWELDQLTNGDHLVCEALKENSRRELRSGGWDITADVAASRRICSAMTEAMSIDNYIEAHAKNRHTVLCGKLAIARAIREAERKSLLWVDHRQGAAFDPGGISDTWYQKFWQLIHQGVSAANVGRIFSGFTIISFNYDRCIQQRLFHGLKSYYHLTDEQALAALRKLDILYPYGSLGDYSNETVFGQEVDPTRLLEIASHLRTFSERMLDDECGEAMKRAVTNASKIVFLGFAFHPQNMRLISTPPTSVGKRIYATAHGISPRNEPAIIRRIKRAFGDNAACEIDHSRCSEFFGNYWYHLSD